MEITQEFLQRVKDIVCSGKPIMTRTFTVAEKGTASNLVTTSDTAVQEMLKEKLGELLPQAVFLGEETESEANGWSILSTGRPILCGACDFRRSPSRW